MLEKWAKLLPYWILMWGVRNQSSADGQGKLILSKEYDINYFQLSDGEFVVFSKDIQDRFDARKESKRKQNLNKKLEKLNKQLRGDYCLKSKLKEQFKDEEKYE